MILNTTLELYDSKIMEALRTRFYSIPEVHWIFVPPDLTFVKAFERFGEGILPIYSVYRIDVPQVADERYSIGNFTLPLRTTVQDKTVDFFKVFLKYQIDFYSDSLYDMNLSIMDFYRFKKQRQLEFKFDDIGLPGESYLSEVMFEDPEENSDITDLKEYNIGRYFRYTYIFTFDCVIFDIKQEVKTEQIIMDFYNTKLSPATQVAEIKVP